MDLNVLFLPEYMQYPWVSFCEPVCWLFHFQSEDAAAVSNDQLQWDVRGLGSYLIQHGSDLPQFIPWI